MKDPIVERLLVLFEERSRVGVQKYGTDLSRSDLSLRDWLYHALFEAMDLSLYLLRIITELEQNEGNS